jgi:hypothetical protein
MKNFKLATAVAFSSLLFFGCDKESESPNSPDTGKQNVAHSTTQGGPTATSHLISNAEPQYRALVGRALDNVEPSPCNAITPLVFWIGKQVAGWSPEAQANADNKNILMTELPSQYAAYFENNSANQYYGPNGEYTHQLTKRFKDLKRFWDIQSDNIVMVAAHGSMMQDRSKVVKAYKTAGYSDKRANSSADSVAIFIKAHPEFLNGNHPYFTLGAYAGQENNYPGGGQGPDKIIMGDGIMQALDGLGYEDIGPQAILAHEFGHHIQFDLGILGSGVQPTPASARRTELMADAYAAYFLSHARGAAMQWKRVQQFHEVFFNTGDCQFELNTHHGTHTQRKAASEWAYNLANDAQKQGHILPSKEFARLFDAALENILKN